jgi:hypothetical protein
MTIDTSQNVENYSNPNTKLSIGQSTGTYGQNFLYTGAGGPYTVAEYSITPSTGEIRVRSNLNHRNIFPTTFYTQISSVSVSTIQR